MRTAMSSAAADRCSLQPLGPTQVLVEFIPSTEEGRCCVTGAVINGEHVDAAEFAQGVVVMWEHSINRELAEEREAQRELALERRND